ncbi:MAG: hypothetical protein ACLT40_10145 [Fusobacterium sp.]
MENNLKTEEAIFNYLGDSDRIFEFLTEAEKKNLIGTSSKESEDKVQELLDELIKKIADGEKTEDLKFFIEELKDAVANTNRAIKREYFAFGILQGTLRENK